MNKTVGFQMLILLTFMFSCDGSMKFDKAKWMTKEDLTYSYRDEMLKDLLGNYKLKGLRYKELVELLGKPEENWQSDSLIIWYEIIMEYGSDIDPVYTKSLQIQLDKDSVVENFKIMEQRAR